MTTTVILKLALLFLLSWTLLPAQSLQKSIKGRVIDSKNAPIPHVNVFLKDTYKSDVTDSDGYFEIRTNRSGSQILIASMIGFEQHSEKIDLNALLTEASK